MNIFYLHKDPVKAAEMHVDKHVVKMILESCQLLSTAHRVLDGIQQIGKSKTGRNVKRWVIPEQYTHGLIDLDSVLYQATHVNHPSAVWVRKSLLNYKWLHALLVALCNEYTYRYSKIHKCESDGLVHILSVAPFNSPHVPFTEPTPAMPDQYKVSENSIQSYRNYYNGEKQRMFSWKKRDVPEFINKTTGENYAII
jgi:hypothetical protein